MSANPSSPPTLRASYDQLPYVCRPHPQTHPEHLATLALLFGVTPPPLATARVLELGCAAGDNLIPMAMQLPQAQFVGVDFSPRQIAVGQEMVAELQLGNIELREGDIGEAMTAAATGGDKPAHGTEQSAASLGTTLLHSFGAGWVEIRCWAPQFCVTPSARPRASPMARLQAKSDGLVKNLRHERVPLDAFARMLLQLLDGTRDRAALLVAVTSDAKQRAEGLRQRGAGPVATGPELAESLARSLDVCLIGLGRAALLCD